MGYNIELSFNILKNSSLKDSIQFIANECNCDSFYEDYEYESKSQFKRNHCIMSINFSQNNMNYLLQFLRFIRGREGLYLELIYDEDTSEILYASQYYITQKMNKSIGKEFKKERRERSYSDDENMILNTIKKN